MPSFIWCEHCGQKIEVKDFVMVNACPACGRSVEGELLASKHPYLLDRIIYLAGAGVAILTGLGMIVYSFLHWKWGDVATWIGLTTLAVAFLLVGIFLFVRKR